VEDIWIAVDGLRVHALADGPADGPLIVLLHGFPELARSWRHQLPALAEAGYRAVAPDQRGYGDTDMRGPYDANTLARDVVGLVRALGRERAVVIGHDWGGAVAWILARAHPEVVERLVAVNCPPPAVLTRELLRNPRQLRRSWYMLFFQLPWLPERRMARDGAAIVARALVGGSYVRSAWPQQEVDGYRTAFARPGRAKAAIDWYRAAFRRSLVPRRRGGHSVRVTAPTLVLFGARDRFLGAELVEPAKLSTVMAPGNEPVVVLVEDAGHYLQNEAPERVNEELLRWLGPAS
jgi:pimeloyl-ACP methyl ester carboxylesterase